MSPSSFIGRKSAIFHSVMSCHFLLSRGKGGGGEGEEEE